jgi:hypothetical protein
MNSFEVGREGFGIKVIGHWSLVIGNAGAFKVDREGLGWEVIVLQERHADPVTLLFRRRAGDEVKKLMSRTN